MSIDVTEMLAVHDCFRREFARLPLLVKSVPEGDTDRALIVAEHIVLIEDFLAVHHRSEEAVVIPLLREREADHADVLDAMEQQHAQLEIDFMTVAPLAEAFVATADAQARAALHVTLIALERDVLSHLAHEETDVLPLIEADLSEGEFAAQGEHSRVEFDRDDLMLHLGMILNDTSPERQAAVLARFPDEVRARFEAEGRAAYVEYRDRLLG